MSSTAKLVCDLIDPSRLRDIVVSFVDIPSPTGDERPLAEHIAGSLSSCGADGRIQAIDDRQANAYGRLRGDGGGADLLLYAPLDTVTSGDATDLPWVAAELSPNLRPNATVDGDLVTGLGAGNPKGHAACVLHAMEVLAHAKVELRGDVIAGFGAGGMPTNARPGSSRANTGQGVGCSFLLEQGVHPDVAVIAKPGVGVTYEEVGLAWFDVTVAGTHTYVGSRHLIPYRNANAAAARVILGLEDWFGGYAQRHTDGQVAPQGVVASVRSGWPWTAAFTPAVCQFRVDLRLSPRTTPAAARREFAAALASIAGELEVVARAEMVLAIPGGRTDPQSWIIQSTEDAWAAEHGQPHDRPTGLSGATDANILRSRGIPTARVGMPKVSGITDFAEGMNTVSLTAMTRLTRVLVRVALDTCTRPAPEVLA